MGRPKCGSLGTFHFAILEQIRTYRINHPEWGAKTILSELHSCERFRQQKLPSISTINRFLVEQKLIIPTPIKQERTKTIEDYPAAQRVHQRWQIDAKGTQTVSGVGSIGFINIKDVYSCLYAGCFPVQMEKPRDNPTANDYRMSLRLSFTKHGLPEQIQVDHGSIFYNNRHPSPFPTLFNLWIVGLGIEMIFSRMGKPTDQGKVERQHRTMSSQLLCKDGFKNWTMLYQQCQLRTQRLNHDIPCRSVDNQAPLKAFENAKHSGRLYRPELETQLFNMKLVDQFLAKSSWKRIIGKNGSVKIANHKYSLKKMAAGQVIQISFDSKDRHFIFKQEDGLFLDRRLAKGLNLTDISGGDFYTLPENFQLQFPFNAKKEIELRLYETATVTTY